MEKLGFIGMGNMGQALAAGFLSSGKVKREQVCAFAPDAAKLAKNAERIGFHPVDSVKELVRGCDTLVLCCKPYQVSGVLSEIRGLLAGKTLLSIALGWDFKRLSDALPGTVSIQFIMPNTPAMAGEGVFLFEEEHSLEPREREALMELFGDFGYVTELPSRLMGIGGAVSGCGPAFVDLLIEAYADAAVRYGIPRETAYRIVSQTVLGAAKLQSVTGLHPGVLKDQVCSPGGTTIRGVAALERSGFRSACMASVDAVMGHEQS